MVGPFAWFKWQALFKDFGVFIDGFKITLLTSLLALILAIVLGVVFGILGTANFKPFKIINRIYVEVIQNIPLVIQVFFMYHVLPHVKIVLPVFVIGVLGLGIYHGAYISEVIRAGIQSVNKGQREAAESQGLSYISTMRYIIIPQAMKAALPPLTNQVVNLIKNTSVLAMIAGGDLMYKADSWSSGNLYYGPAYVITGLLYLLVCLPIARFAKRLERKAVVSQ